MMIQRVLAALDMMLQRVRRQCRRCIVGLYLLCKAIHEQSDNKVILTGEISDEIFGYKYTDFAPSPEEFQKEMAAQLEK